MKYNKILFAAFAVLSFSCASACTNLIVGRKASVDGSVLVSYNADSYGCYGVMAHYAAGHHPKGTMRRVYDWESSRFRGEIEEAPETYNVVGNMNQFQVTIGETTFGGREELVDTTGQLDYGSMIYIALQRSRTAREAIRVMTDLAARYGYASEGESFTLADPREVWIMEMVGKGPGGHGALWVAVRIPDDCISAHANQSRIHRFMQYDKADCLYSPDVVTFARKKGLFSGKTADFDFANAYCPATFDGLRYCEARVWSFFNKWTDGMDRYLGYASGLKLQDPPMPLFVKPKRLLSVQDIEASMRDHYEGTPFSLTDDPGAGPYLMPYRPRPLSWKCDGKEYFNERAISTQQSSFAFVAQMRSFLPDAIGGILWFGNDDANMIAYTPVYCCATQVPDCYTEKYGNSVHFSLKSAFWVCNWVANMVYPRYSLMFEDVRQVRDTLEQSFFHDQPVVEEHAKTLVAASMDQAVAYLTRYSLDRASEMMDRWIALGERLIVKYNDMVVKPEKDGRFQTTPEGLGAPVINVGYSDQTRRKIVDATGDKYLVPKKP